MTSPGVMWTFLGMTRAITLVGDICTMWARRVEKLKIFEVGHRKEASVRNYESRSFEVSEVPKLGSFEASMIEVNSGYQ
jgi:hypothetical protein